MNNDSEGLCNGWAGTTLCHFLPGRPPACTWETFDRAGKRESRNECKLILWSFITLLQFNEVGIYGFGRRDEVSEVEL